MNVAEQLKLIPGAPLPLGAKVYVCPAMNIKLMRMFKDQLKLVSEGMAAATSETADGKVQEYLGALVAVTTAALVRNYPDITEEIVEEGIDLNNIKEVALAVMGASGYITSSQEQAEMKVYGDPGEPTGTA